MLKLLFVCVFLEILDWCIFSCFVFVVEFLILMGGNYLNYIIIYIRDVVDKKLLDFR